MQIFGAILMVAGVVMSIVGGAGMPSSEGVFFSSLGHMAMTAGFFVYLAGRIVDAIDENGRRIEAALRPDIAQPEKIKKQPWLG